MAANRIQVKQTGKTTAISVDDWPDPNAAWCVNSSDDRGRLLIVVGYHRFRKEMQVGQVRLHVETKKPLTILSYELADSLIRGDRAEALAQLVLCVRQIAMELHDQLGVGDGHVEWQIDHQKFDDVQRLFPEFEAVKKRFKRKRGKRYLRI